MPTPRNPSHRTALLGLALSLALGAGIGFLFTPYMGTASFSFGLLLTGTRVGRRNRALHRLLMGTGALLDLVLVLVLEAGRGAIAEALSFEMSLPQQLHILFSTLALVAYFPLIVLGAQVFRGSSRWTTTHRSLGIVAIGLRTLGFLLMFSLLDHVRSGGAN